MPIVADYQAIRGAPFSLLVGQDIDWQADFKIGNSARLNQPMILQFFYRSHLSARNLTFRFSINGKAVRNINVSATGGIRRIGVKLYAKECTIKMKPNETNG